VVENIGFNHKGTLRFARRISKDFIDNPGIEKISGKN
jgi:hypothetical protein